MHAGFDAGELLTEFLTREPAHAQGGTGFGEPAITVYRGQGFYLEVLYWLDATTSIHQHAFSGAFQVLVGGSLHAIWRRHDSQGRETAPAQRAPFWLGELSCTQVERLRVGDVRAIVAGAGFIHALFHLERPSVSLVARTTREAEHLPQLNYLPPHVAYDPFEAAPLRARRLEALTLLAQTDPPALDGAMQALARADLPTWFHAMRLLATPATDPAKLAAWAEQARPHHGQAVDRIMASLRERLRQAHITARRGQVTDPELRWFLALLLNVPTRADILRLVREAGHATDPEGAILGWIRRLAVTPQPTQTLILDIEVAHEPGGSARVVAIFVALVRGMLRTLSTTAILDGVAADVPDLLGDERVGLAALIQGLRRPTAPFGSLFR